MLMQLQKAQSCWSVACDVVDSAAELRNFISKSSLLKPKYTKTEILPALLSRVLVKLLSSL